MMNFSFVCTRCVHVDDVDLAHSGQLPADPEKQLCTFCKTGTWHGLFEYLEYNPEKDMVINRPSGLSL